MKNSLFILLFISSGLVYYSSFQSTASENAKRVSDYYSVKFMDFKKELDQLPTYIANKRIGALQQQLTKIRLTYKEIEFIYDYLNTSYNYYKINGAPLPKFDQSYTNNKILEPNGLQTLDELIFGADPDLDEIEQITSQLLKDVNLSAEIHFPFVLSEQQIFEAMRSGLIRIFTLGVTGFDTPSSDNALSESLNSLKSIGQVFDLMAKDSNINTEKYEYIVHLISLGSEQLNYAPDFDQFDRLKFLKEVINPLYKELLEYQDELGIDIENLKRPNAHNYESTNLFARDFINSNFYSYRSYIPLDNKKSIALGKQLFFDKALSQDGKMSCATCHDPKKGFADGLPKSPSNIAGIFTERNSPTVVDAGFASRQFWDMREFNLELQVAHVVGNGKEFNTSFEQIISRIENIPEYKAQFNALYGEISDRVIYDRSISNAIAAYVNSLQSFNSEFDRFVRDEIEQYPKDAYKGFNLFAGKAACATCHFTPIFNGTVPPFYTETESEVLGVTNGFNPDNPVLDADEGRLVNNNIRDQLPHFRHAFKTVSVRNSGLTAPYMHNGSFKTLEEVLEFYNLGGGNGMGLTIENQTLSDQPLNLSKKEIKQIIAFLHTLSDTTGLTTVPKPKRSDYFVDD